MKEWKKPFVSESNFELTECTAEELREVNGGDTILGSCLGIGLGGDFDTGEGGVGIGLCFLVGGGVIF